MRERTLGYLDKLRISNRIIPTPKRRRKVDTVEYRRAKLIANVEEQLELVNLSIRKKPLQLIRKRGRKTQTVRPRLWWSVEHDGVVLTQIRYNKIALNLPGGGTTIEARDLKELVSVFETVIRAIEVGELDPAIATAASKSQPK